MTAIDVSPLLRAAIGFDRVANILGGPHRLPDNSGWPPYNIERTSEDTYVLSMAVAGFSEADIEVITQDGTLLVTGKAPDHDSNRVFLHRGIAARAFERRFALADYIHVEAAKLENGMLLIIMRREVPEAKKPRRIAISSTAPNVLDVETPKAA